MLADVFIYDLTVGSLRRILAQAHAASLDYLVLQLGNADVIIKPVLCSSLGLLFPVFSYILSIINIAEIFTTEEDGLFFIIWFLSRFLHRVITFSRQ